MVKVIWQGRIATTHASVNRIRKVAPVCAPSNGWFLGPTRASHPKRHLDQFSGVCRAQHTDIHADRGTCDIAATGRMHTIRPKMKTELKDRRTDARPLFNAFRYEPTRPAASVQNKSECQIKACPQPPNWTKLDRPEQIDPVTRRVICHVRQRHERHWLQFANSANYCSRTGVQFSTL